MLGDAPGRGAAVAALAVLVPPHLHVHLHEVAGLAPALPQRPPARHRHHAVHVVPAPGGQADGLDVGVVLHVAVQRQDRNVIPLKNLESV